MIKPRYNILPSGASDVGEDAYLVTTSLITKLVLKRERRKCFERILTAGEDAELKEASTVRAVGKFEEVHKG